MNKLLHRKILCTILVVFNPFYRTGQLLDGTTLPRTAIQEFITMQRRSFVPIVRSVTPPPTSEPQGMSDGPWIVTAEDLSSGSSMHTPDYGMEFIVPGILTHN